MCHVSNSHPRLPRLLKSMASPGRAAAVVPAVPAVPAPVSWDADITLGKEPEGGAALMANR